jgi:hypothetical protein
MAHGWDFLLSQKDRPRLPLSRERPMVSPCFNAIETGTLPPVGPKHGLSIACGRKARGRPAASRPEPPRRVLPSPDNSFELVYRALL